MRSKALLAVLFGVVSFAAAARAEIPVSLIKGAPYSRSLVKARLTEKADNQLNFLVERIYVGDEIPRLSLPAYRWPKEWGKAKNGFEGYFVFSQNPDVDTIFPIEGDRARTFYPGTVAEIGERTPEWQPLAEVERQLTAIARRHRALVVAFSRSEELSGFQVVFTNRGNERMTVNRGGLLVYRVFDFRGKVLAELRDPADGNLRTDYVELEPGESTSIDAPPQLSQDLAGQRVKVAVIYTNMAEGPSLWSGTKETRPFLVEIPGSASPSKSSRSKVVVATAPTYTGLAMRAGIEGEVRVNVDVLPDGRVDTAAVIGEGLPIGLNAASVEAAKKWRFAPAEEARRQELVFEFRTVGYCDLAPPPSEQMGDYKVRVWKQREKRDEISYAMGATSEGTLQCTKISTPAPDCAF